MTRKQVASQKGRATPAAASAASGGGFDDLRIIDHKGQQWLTAGDIAKALGYRDTSAVNRLYTRNSDEFSKGMTSSVKLTDRQIGRIFSLRGAHLLALFAKTERAKAFRRWVLDLIEGEHKKPGLSDDLGLFLAATSYANARNWAREDGRSEEEVAKLDAWAKDAFSRLIVAEGATTISVALTFRAIYGEEPDTAKALRPWINKQQEEAA